MATRYFCNQDHYWIDEDGTTDKPEPPKPDTPKRVCPVHQAMIETASRLERVRDQGS